MLARLFSDSDDAELWFAARATSAIQRTDEPMPGLKLLFDSRQRLRAVRFENLGLLPYEWRKAIRHHAGTEAHVELQSTYDPALDMGSLEIDFTWSSYSHSVTASGVNIDVAEDGTIRGFEIFGPSTTLPEMIIGP